MKKIFLYSLITILLMPAISMAAGKTDTYTLLEPLPCISGTDSKCVTSSSSDKTVNDIALSDYIGYIFKFAIALAAFLAVVMIIWGGFEYMTIESFTGKSDAKKKIYDALTGLLMVLASYLILRTIDPRLVEIQTSIPQLKISQTDINAINGFQNDQAIDLSSFTNDAQDKIKGLVAQNNADQARIDELNDLDIYGDGSTLTSEENLELEILKDNVASSTVAINSTVAKETGSLSYEKAANILSNPNATADELLNLKNNYYDPNAAIVPNIRDANGNLPINTPNVIQNQYNNEINKIVKTDPEAAQQLANQRDFYISQIAADVALTDKTKTQGNPIYSQGSTYAPPSVTGYVDNTAFLQSKLTTYTNNLADQAAINDVVARTGISADEYKKIIQSRIDTIKQALDKTKK